MARKKSRRPRSKKRVVSFMTKKGRVTFKAKKNPVGPRLGTLAIVAGAAFIAYRAYQRQQLAQKLENDRTIAAARSTLMTTGFVAQGYEWLSEPDGVQKEVNRLLPWFGTNSPEEAYEQLKEKMRKDLQIPSAQSAEQAVRQALRRLGLPI
jgi:hypothetical protein